MALALQTVLDDLGKGLGPLLVSLMVSAWGACVPSLAPWPPGCQTHAENRTMAVNEELPLNTPARPLFPSDHGRAGLSSKRLDVIMPDVSLSYVRVQQPCMLPCWVLEGMDDAVCCAETLCGWWGHRQAAFNVAIAGWIPCGAIFASIAFFLAKEEDDLQVRGFTHSFQTHQAARAGTKMQNCAPGHCPQAMKGKR